jgi:hypothetical protein
LDKFFGGNGSDSYSFGLGLRVVRLVIHCWASRRNVSCVECFLFRSTLSFSGHSNSRGDIYWLVLGNRRSLNRAFRGSTGHGLLTRQIKNPKPRYLDVHLRCTIQGVTCVRWIEHNGFTTFNLDLRDRADFILLVIGRHLDLVILNILVSCTVPLKRYTTSEIVSMFYTISLLQLTRDIKII